MAKPTEPNISIPQGFANEGQKTDFLEEKIQKGFDPVDPDVLAGDNLNKFIDDTYKGLNYTIDGVNDLYKGVVLYDSSETYSSTSIVFSIADDEISAYKSLTDDNLGNPLTDETKWKKVNLGSGGGGLELCDIGMSLYIDETKGLRRRLNGQVVAINANTQAFLNRLKQIVALYPSLSVTETAWQAAKTASAYGQVGRFVIDEEAGTVRLPAVVNVQGALDLQNLGLTVEAGLPDHTHTVAINLMDDSTAAGWVGVCDGDNGILNGAVYTSSGASASNAIYGNSDTVQPEAVQYPYFIQIATGQEIENNIVNELELCNPFVLLEPKYSESLLYNESWLRSNGQWNAKALYVSVYEALQVEYNSEIDAGSTVTLPSGGAYAKRGLPVKLSTEEYTDYDHVLNTSEETFRLALKTMFKPVKNGTVPVVGTGSSLGLTDGTTEYGLKVASGNAYQLLGASSSVNQPAGATNTYFWSLQNKVVGVSTNPNNSGLSADLTDTTGLYLYFYAGAVSQNAGLVNAGWLEEALVDKTNFAQAAHAAMPATTRVDLTLSESGSNYVLPADGYLSINKAATATNQNIFMQNNSNDALDVNSMATAAGHSCCCWTLGKKGDSIKVSYTAAGTLYDFCFIPAVGAQ
mgnify:CR=1 FL=1